MTALPLPASSDDVSDSSEDALTPAVARQSKAKSRRRDTGLSGKYWASEDLPAKRKRFSVVERNAEEVQRTKIPKTREQQERAASSHKEKDKTNSTLNMKTGRESRRAVSCSPVTIRDLKDIRNAEKAAAPTEKSHRRKMSPLPKPKMSLSFVKPRVVESENVPAAQAPASETGRRSEVGSHSAVIKNEGDQTNADQTDAESLFNDHFMESPQAGLKNKYTEFSSLAWKNIKSDTSKLPDAFQYSVAQLNPGSRLSYIKMKPYAMHGSTHCEAGAFFVVLEGTLHLYVDHKLFNMQKGDSYFASPKSRFNMTNFSQSDIIVAVMQFKYGQAEESST